MVLGRSNNFFKSCKKFFVIQKIKNFPENLKIKFINTALLRKEFYQLKQ